MKANSVGLFETTMKVTILANYHRFAKIAILIKKVPIVRCAVSTTLTAARGRAVAIGRQVRRPGEWIARLIVLDDARYGALTIHMRLRAFGNPAVRRTAVSGEERNKWGTRHLDAHVSGRANKDRITKLDKNDRSKIFAEYV